MPARGTGALRVLKRDHAESLRLIGRLRRLCAPLKVQRALNTATRAEMLSLSRLLLDFKALHVRRENEVLFPRMEALMGDIGAPLLSLERQHDDIGEGLRIFGSRVAALRSATGRGAIAEAEGVGIVLKYLDTLVRNHIAREEALIFPMAEKLIDRGRMAEMGRRMEMMGRPYPSASHPAASSAK